MKNNHKHNLILFISVFLLFTLSIGTASAKTIYVDDDGSAVYTKIKDAIRVASNGDVIIVNNGTYYENVHLYKQLTLKGVDYPVIDANGNRIPILINKDNCTIIGFKAVNSSKRRGDAGIVLRADHCLISNNIASDNYYGISLERSNHNNILNNTVDSNLKSGIYLSSDSNNNTLNYNIGDVQRGISPVAAVYTSMILVITIFAIGWLVAKTGITISNVFYGLGSYTAVVTILYIMTNVEIPGWTKVIILFTIAFIAIGLGYYVGRRR
ncbi:MAG: NosD domain-containing protein [Halobacteriota archaeon]|nr:NosD domain-containing protein [Halobacteriota archaeon]